MGVDAGLPVPSLSGADTATNGFVVGEAAIAEGQVVHAALGSGTGRKSLENNVGDSLGSQDVATDHGGSFRRIQQGALG